MTFVNEFISQEDVEKYGIRDIDRRFLRVTFQPDWTVDKGRNIYLRFVGSGREEFADQKEFTLYWRGWLLMVLLDQKISVSSCGEKLRHYKLLQLDLPDEIEAQRMEIISNLKEALIAYQGVGVYASRQPSTTTSDF